MSGFSRTALCLAQLHLQNSIRTFSGTSALLRNTGLSRGKPLRIALWREKRDIPRCGNQYGPLTDLPDWRYEDGRPGSMSRGQRKRLEQSDEYAQQISFLLNEVDSAVNTHETNQQEAAARREYIIKNKLREKGLPFPDAAGPAKSTAKGQ